MLRYEKLSQQSNKRWLKHYNKRQKLQIIKRNVSMTINTSLPSTKYTIYIPNHWSIFVLKAKNNYSNYKVIHLTSSTYFFNIPYNTNLMRLKIDKYTPSLNWQLLETRTLMTLFWKNLQKLLYLPTHVQFVRMKFRGKGYYIYKTLRNTVAPNFGYAHRVYVYAYFVSLKFLSKTAIILFGLLKTDLFKAGQAFKKTRPINVFTGRGVRFNRQIVYRKTGKVSTYR